MISTRLDNTIRTRFSLIVPRLVDYSNDYSFVFSPLNRARSIVNHSNDWPCWHFCQWCSSLSTLNRCGEYQAFCGLSVVAACLCCREDPCNCSALAVKHLKLRFHALLSGGLHRFRSPAPRYEASALEGYDANDEDMVCGKYSLTTPHAPNSTAYNHRSVLDRMRPCNPSDCRWRDS